MESHVWRGSYPNKAMAMQPGKRGPKTRRRCPTTRAEDFWGCLIRLIDCEKKMDRIALTHISCMVEITYWKSETFQFASLEHRNNTEKNTLSQTRTAAKDILHKTVSLPEPKRTVSNPRFVEKLWVYCYVLTKSLIVETREFGFSL